MIGGYNQDGLGLDDDLVGDAKTGAVDVATGAERRADAFAASLLIPPGKLDDFIRETQPRYSKVRIKQFANAIKVHPGIILGQLHRRGEISYASNREMLVKIRDAVTKTSATDGWGEAPSSD